MQQSLPSLDDMVFENRNKLYGAFDLRKSYASHLYRATLIGIGLVLLLIGSSFIFANENVAGYPRTNLSSVRGESPALQEEAIFTTVEVEPTFEGGVSEMYHWIYKNLHYPENAIRAHAQGKVYLKFIVEKDGSISKPEVLKGIGFGCDEEAVRLLKAMPKWRPGMQNNTIVRVYSTLAVVFKL